jgi:hypothetical protein
MKTGRGQNLAFCGQPGTGKTYAASRLVQTRPRVIWIDPSGTTRLHPAQFSVRSVEEVERIFERYATAQVVVYVEHLLEHPEVFARVVDGVLRFALDDPREFTVVVDEFKLVSKNGRTTPLMDKALRAGRHFGVSLWPITQRALDLRPDIRACMDRVWFFRVTDRSDLHYLRDIDPTLAAAVVGPPRLPNRLAAVLNVTTGEWVFRKAP